MSDQCNLVEDGSLLICKAHDKIAELRDEIERLEAALADAIAWHEAERGNEPGDSPRMDGWRAALAGKEPNRSDVAQDVAPAPHPKSNT
jgi:hypothetical protein